MSTIGWKRTQALAGCGLAIVMAAAGCCGNGGDRRAQIEKETATRAPDPATPWSVRLGSRGGFTGGASGHTIRSDGTVISWSQITPDDSIETQPLGRATPETLAELERAMRPPELSALKHQEQGNMTAFLEWRQGADHRVYSWIDRMRGPSLPQPLQRAHDAAMAVVRAAKP